MEGGTIEGYGEEGKDEDRDVMAIVDSEEDELSLFEEAGTDETSEVVLDVSPI